MLVDFYPLFKSFRPVGRVIQSHSDSLYGLLVVSNFASAYDIQAHNNCRENEIDCQSKEVAVNQQLPKSPMCQRSCRLNISEDNHAPLFTGT